MILAIAITAIISLILGFGTCALFSGKRIAELEEKVVEAHKIGVLEGMSRRGKGIVEVEE